MSARLHRRAYNTPGAAHELTFSCYQRLKFLTCECIGRACARLRGEFHRPIPGPFKFTGCSLCGRSLIACRWLAETINDAAHRLDFAVVAYVFMPEHVHLIVYPRRDDYEIARILRQVKQPVARKAMCYLKAQSPELLSGVSRRRGARVERLFWQSGGGYDRNISETRTREAMMRYVHANPERRGLVESSLDWPYSSARWYEELGEGPVRVETIE